MSPIERRVAALEKRQTVGAVRWVGRIFDPADGEPYGAWEAAARAGLAPHERLIARYIVDPAPHSPAEPA
jgi:hypothetical protein